MPFARGDAVSGGGPSFTPVQASDADRLLLPPEFDSRIVALWGDTLPGGRGRFGYNADFTAFLPLSPDAREGVLWVNHEYVSVFDEEDGECGIYTQTFPLVMGREPTLEDQLTDIGATVLHLRRTGAEWQIVDSRLTRRYDVNSRMRASGPALQKTPTLTGTLANCSGAVTPWNTILTCEENYQKFVPDDVDTSGRGSSGGRFGRPSADYGWVVECDPFDPTFVPVKHTMLGRFRHENVALRAMTGAPLVAYMGDDRTNGHVYRFVSRDRYAGPAAAHRGSLLSRGRLAAAVFHADGTGEWRELDERTRLAPNDGAPAPPIPRGAATLGQVYEDLGAIVTDAFRAANLIGATPTGRPEDVEVHPLDGSVYIAFTDRATAPGSPFTNVYGEIVRLVDEDDGTGRRFAWMRWKAGGTDADAAGAGFAAPDNLAFDRAGNMWVITDIRSDRLNADARYAAFRNNGMFFVPTSGREAGRAFQFASGPCECELTGPSWTPDETTLFLSVQHPGSANGIRMTAADAPRGSNWPSDRPGAPPRPGVVAVGRRG
jgi:secreted PhoX family phosphatase